MLSDKGFARIHKSHLINVSPVTAYKKGKGGSVMLGTVELPVSPSILVRKKCLLWIKHLHLFG
jgi:two-component system LytT family response regulator